MANKIKQFTLGLVESATEYSIKKFIQETGITPVDYMFSNNKIGQGKILIVYTDDEEATEKELPKICRFSQQKSEDVERSIVDYIQTEILDKKASIKDIRKVDEERIAFEIDPKTEDTKTYEVHVCELPMDNNTCDLILDNFLESVEIPDDYSIVGEALWCGRYLILITSK